MSTAISIYAPLNAVKLPIEVEALHALVRELKAQIDQKNKDFEALKKRCTSLQNQINELHSPPPPVKVITKRPR